MSQVIINKLVLNPQKTIEKSQNVCINNRCNVKASYNYVNNVPAFCSLHKTSTMVNVVRFQKCIVQNCNNEIKYHDYCRKHEPNSEPNTVPNRRQKTPCDTLAFVCEIALAVERLDRKYEKYILKNKN